MSQILKIDDINVFYGSIHAIKGISLEVNEGEIVTLIGANGAGKTTTLHTVSGLLRPRSGSIQFCGEDITRIPAHKLVERGLAHCPEGRRIFLQMTVQENLDILIVVPCKVICQHEISKDDALCKQARHKDT